MFKLAVKNWLAKTLLLGVLPLLVSANASTNYRESSFDLYHDGNNVLYFIARERLLLISGSINIPIVYFDGQSFSVDLNDINYPLTALNPGFSTDSLISVDDYSLYYGDFNGDGKEDIYAHPKKDGSFYSALLVEGGSDFLPNSLMGFDTVQNYSVTDTSVSIKDVDYDGVLDVVLNLPTKEEISLLEELDIRPRQLSPKSSSHFDTTTAVLSVSKGGAANVQIPITTPTGATGLSANVSLSYDSQVSSGSLGAGWSVGSVGAVTRCVNAYPDNLALVYSDADSYCLNGVRLVAIDGDYGADGTLYRTEKGSDLLVTSHGRYLGGPSKWSVSNPNGTVIEYGGTENSRLETHDNSSVVKWSENKKTLISNASYTVNYIKNRAIGESVVKEIDYTNQDASIEFVWEGRADATYGWTQGRKFASTKKLQAIRMVNDGQLQRIYKIFYSEDKRNHRPLVSAIQECNSEGGCISPVTFGWESTGTQYGYTDSATHFPSTSHDTIIPVDLNNDGYNDFIGYSYGDDKVLQILNNKNRTYTERTLTNTLLAEKQKFISDVNGDGYSDVMVIDRTAPTPVYYIWHGSEIGFGAQPSETGYVNLAEGSPVQLSDLNSDGYPEVVQTLENGDLKIHLGQSDSFALHASKTVTHDDFEQAHILFSDLNLDGVVDIVAFENDPAKPTDGTAGSAKMLIYLASNRAFDYTTTSLYDRYSSNLTISDFANASDTDFEAPIPTIEKRYAPSLVDMTGDGVPDIVSYSGEGHHTLNVYQGYGDGGFSTQPWNKVPVQLHYERRRENVTEDEEELTRDIKIHNRLVYFQDINGDGKKDILEHMPLANEASYIYRHMAGNEIFDAATLHTDIAASATEKTSYIFTDLDGNGVVDYAKVEDLNSNFAIRMKYSSIERRPKLLTVTDGYGNQSQFGWASMNDGEVYTKRAIDRSNSVERDIISSRKLVRSLSTNSGNEYYKYAEAVQSFDEAGYKGFRAYVKVTDRIVHDGSTSGSGSTKTLGIVTAYLLRHDYPFVGKTETLLTKYSNSQTAQETYEDLTFAEYDGRLYPKFENAFLTDDVTLANFRENNWQVIELPNGIKQIYQKGYTSRQYDQKGGNLVNTKYHTQTLEVPQGAYYARVDKSESTADGLKVVVDHEYEQSGVFGYSEDFRVNKTTTTYSNDDPNVAVISDVVDYTYTTNGRLESKTQNAQDPAAVKVEYAYSNAPIETLYSVTTSNPNRSVTHVQYVAPRKEITEYSSLYKYKYLTKKINVVNLNDPTLNHETILSNYNKFGEAERVTYANGLSETYAFDDYGTVVQQADSFGNKTAITLARCSLNECLDNGRRYIKKTIVSADDTQISGTSYEVFDHMGNSIATYSQLMDGSYSTVFSGYDRHGRLTTFSAPVKIEVGAGASPLSLGEAVYTTDYRYDVMDRVVQIRADSEDRDGNALDSVKNISYSASNLGNGYTKTITDGLNRVRKETYNGRGKLIRTSQNFGAEAVSISYIYDAKDRLVTESYPTASVDSQGNPIVGAGANHEDTTLFNEQNGTIVETIPDREGAITRYINIFGETSKVVNANGQATTFKYDTLGRITEQRQPESLSCWYYDNFLNQYGGKEGTGALDMVVQYEATVSTCPNSYTAAELEGLQDDSTVLQFKRYTLDSNAQLVSEKQGIEGDVYATEYSYDSYGRLDIIDYPTADIASTNNLAVEYNYNDYGFLTQLSDADSGKIYSTDTAVDKWGNVISKTLGDNTVTQSFTEMQGRAKSIKAVSSNTPDNVNLTYRYNRVGEMVDRLDYINDRHERFSYAGGYGRQLKTVQVSTIGSYNYVNEEVYAYDSMGNIVQYNLNDNGQVKNWTYNYSGKQLSSITATNLNARFEYDDSGNTETIEYDPFGFQADTFTYTSFNKVSELHDFSDDVTVTYLYDENQTRYKRVLSESGTLESTIMIGGLYERVSDSEGNVEHRYYVGGETLVTVDQNNNTSTSYFVHDHLGSLVAIVDEHGMALARYRYRVFGERVEVEEKPRVGTEFDWTNQAFTGHERIADIGITHMGGRIYSDKIGRFLQADIINYDNRNPVSYSRYAYVLNNPLGYTDPTGYAPEDITGVQDSGGPTVDGELTAEDDTSGKDDTTTVLVTSGETEDGTAYTEFSNTDGTGSITIYGEPDAELTDSISDFIALGDGNENGGGGGGPGKGPDDPEDGVDETEEAESDPPIVASIATNLVDVIPFVGSAKSVVQVITGRDLFTGEKVNRGWELVGVVAGLVPGGKLAVKSGRLAKKAIGACSFVAGTLVLVSGDAYASIEDIAEGDAVVSRPESGILQVQEQIVNGTFVEWHDEIVELEVEASDGTTDVIRTTDNHPFWVPGKGWLQAGELTLRDVLETIDGDEVSIISISTDRNGAYAYNFEVDEYHTYAVGEMGLWVHNSFCDLPVGKTVGRTKEGAPRVLVKDEAGNVKNITSDRVKEYKPNTHPKAPEGTMDKVRFENAQPGSKGYKRDPTPEEIEMLKEVE